MKRFPTFPLLTSIGLILALGCQSATPAPSARRRASTASPVDQAVQPTARGAAGDESAGIGAAGAPAEGARQGAATPTAGSAAEGAAQAPRPVVPAERQAKVQFYIMSQCPFGVQVLDGIIPALRQIGPWVDFQVDFIGDINGDQLSSMHGEAEVQGNIVELCTIKYAPDKWLDMFSCWNKDFSNLPGNWKGCAAQSRLDAAKTAQVASCIEGPEGKALLKASFEKAKGAGATGSPTIFLNGAPYQGGRDERAFLTGICNALPEPKPETCANIPPPPRVNVLVVGDRRCTKPECQTANMVGQLKGLFTGLVVTEQDWGTPEGKATYAEHGLQLLPAYIFDATVEADAAGLQRIQRYLRPTTKAGYRFLDIGANHNPNNEICDNKVDDTGDGKVDCDDDTCKQAMVCRAELKGSVQLFIMSQCPYGVQALDAMREVLDAFKGEITFDVHFIANIQGEGFGSLHGQPEVDENIRELCAMKLLPNNNKFMAYFWCRNKNISSTEYQSCVTEAGMDLARFDACATGDEGKQLLRDDIAVTQALGFSSSPTWLINNTQPAHGADPRSIQQAICTHNPGLQGCSATLTGPAPRPQGGGGGCG